MSAAGICPCCGQPVADGDDLIISLDTNSASRWGEVVRMQPQAIEILHALNEAFPGSLDEGRFMSALWGITDGPDQPSNLVKSRISTLRTLMASLGVAIDNVQPRKYRLRFEPQPIRYLAPRAGRRRREVAA